MTTATATAPVTSVDKPLIDVPKNADLRKAYVRNIALASWSYLTDIPSIKGAKLAFKVLGKMIKFNKGQTARQIVKNVAEVDLSLWDETAKLMKNDDLKKLNDRKATLTEEQYNDQVNKLNVRYMEAGMYWATFSRDEFLRHVKIVREHLNTLAVTVKTKAATGAEAQMSVDQAINDLFGQQIKLADFNRSISLGLVR